MKAKAYLRQIKLLDAKIEIGMEELAGLINETRINVSRKLNELREKSIIQLRRKEIHIPEMADFLRELQP